MFNLARTKAVAYGSYYYYTTDWSIPTVFNIGTVDGSLILKRGQEISDEDAEQYVFDIFFAYVNAECRFISAAISAIALNDYDFHDCKMAYMDKIDAIFGLKMFPKLYDTLKEMPIETLEETITLKKDERFASYMYSYDELRAEIFSFLAIDQSHIEEDLHKCRKLAIEYAKEMYHDVDTSNFLPEDVSDDFENLVALYVGADRTFVDECLRELSQGTVVQSCFAVYIYKLYLAECIRNKWKSYLESILPTYLRSFYNTSDITDYSRQLLLNESDLFDELNTFVKEEY